MVKGKSKQPGKAHAGAPVLSGETRNKASKKAAFPRRVRKHLRQLERQLSDATRQERRRLRKLDRATFRRQMLQAELEDLRGETPIAAATLVEPTPAPEPHRPPEPAAPAAPAAATVAKATRKKTATTRPAATVANAPRKRTATKRPTTRRRPTGDSTTKE